ncbi:diguanylate cyclase domain protein [Clostridiales bacterium oral taxon 876 str. F0540]|nr:diguanylate cyclase domain protein [Clostridiales bacterium oral taxon 876 str. F0540]
MDKKSKEYKVFLFWNISLAIWAFAYSFAYTASDVYEFGKWNKLSAAGWCTFPAITLYLVLTITGRKLKDNILSVFFIFMPAAILLYMTLFLFFPGIVSSKLISNLFYIGDFFYSFIYLLSSILLIYFWGRRSQSSNVKKQAKVIVITSLIPFLMNITNQTILPAFGIRYFPDSGQIYSLIMLWGVNYAIVKYQFMNIPSSSITNELFNKISDLTFLVDLEGRIVKTGKHIYYILDYREEEIEGTHISKIIRNENLKHLIANYQLIDETVKLKDVYISSKRGNIVPFNLSVTPLKDSCQKRTLGILIVGQDVRLIKNLQEEITRHSLTSDRLRESEEMFRTMIETAPFASIMINRENHKFIYINSKTRELFNLKEEDYDGEGAEKYYYNLVDRQEIISDIQEGRTVKEREITFKRKDNSIIYGLVTIIPTIYNEQEALLICITDVTEQRLSQDKLRESYEELDRVNRELLTINYLLHEKSVKDGLTNLFNHQHINEVLKFEIAKARKLDTSLWVMMLDIDYFKRINDNFGHQAGDKVLIQVSNLIESSIRSTDYAGRYGGEEFFIVLSELSFEEAYEVAERIRTNIESFDFGVDDMKVTVSIGLSKLNKEDEKQLVNKADTMLYKAKRNGRNRIEYI